MGIREHVFQCKRSSCFEIMRKTLLVRSTFTLRANEITCRIMHRPVVWRDLSLFFLKRLEVNERGLSHHLRSSSTKIKTWTKCVRSTTYIAYLNKTRTQRTWEDCVFYTWSHKRLEAQDARQTFDLRLSPRVSTSMTLRFSSRFSKHRAEAFVNHQINSNIKVSVNSW